MGDETKLITSTQWVHSCRVRQDNKDFISVKEKVVTIDEKNNIVNSKDQVRIISKPKRKVWVTKEQFRNHTDKKESEDINKLDEYVVLDKDLPFELKRILGHGYKKRFMSLKELCNSPYVYGADINIEALVRMKYHANAKHRVIELTTGAYDHEQSVIGCKRINAITVVLGTQVYTAVLEDFTHNNVDEHGAKFTSDLPMLLDYAHKTLEPYTSEHKFELNMQVFKTEVEMFKYIAAAIHKHKTDFIGIWNIDYDIPSLMDRCAENGVRFEDIMFHPDIPKKFRYAWYKEDKRKTQHNTDKWPWLHSVGYTQFMDAMLAYARIRKNQSKEPSYTLDAISSKVVGTGKLQFDDGLDHYEMQTKHFMKYVAYNIADAILIQLMFWKTHDPEGLYELTGISPIYDFSKQTTMLKDQLFDYYLAQGRVLGSSGREVNEPHAKLLEKLGGTVLSPYLLKGAGLHAIEGFPGIETFAYANNFDEDYESIYPSIKMGYGISKETKLWTLVFKDNVKLEKLCSGLPTPMESAVPICSEFLNLRTYEEMSDEFEKYATKYLLRH